MGREVKRVAADFEWPLNKVWEGYLRPSVPCPNGCEASEEYDPNACKLCYGDGTVLDNVDPPAGEGWQMWEDTSEGSPISPVFGSPEELATWLADTGASSFGYQTATRDQWLRMILGPGWAPSAVSVGGGPLVSGVAGFKPKPLALSASQKRVAEHHRDQFGAVPLSVRGMKLGEEAGEVQAALVRHLSRRDGREWLPEVRSEIGDVMVALMGLADSLGLDLEEITDEAVERFCARTWDVTRWGDGEEVARG